MSVSVLELDGVGGRKMSPQLKYSNVAVQVYALTLGQSDLQHLKAMGPRGYMEL